jgi:hypothetical protein
MGASCRSGGVHPTHRLNKFIWAPCHVMCKAVLIGSVPATPPPSPAFGLVLRGRYWSAKIDDISF